LHFACALDNPEITALILKHIPNSLNSISKADQTPLHIACSKNRIDSLKVLLGQVDLDVKCIDINGFTPLLKACSSLSYDAAYFLINNIESPSLLINNTDKSGYTALHYTLEDNNTKLSMELIKLGAKYDIKDNEGKVCFELMKDKNMKDLILNFISRDN
jgi:ankyrin repeat protein